VRWTVSIGWRVCARRPSWARTAVLVRSSAGEAGDADRGRGLGAAVYLMKPATQSDLWEAVASALGRRDSRHAVGPGRGAALRATISRRLRLLLAEDNVVTPRLAVRMLARQGHAVVVAHDGRQAADAFEYGRFDAILMAGQLPGHGRTRGKGGAPGGTGSRRRGRAGGAPGGASGGPGGG